MDYFSVFEISTSGMEVQKARLNLVAMNLANVSTTQDINGGPYQAKTLIISENGKSSFDTYMINNTLQLRGAEISGVKALNNPPRLVFEPAHPQANSKGYVEYPNIDPASEMMTLIEATRAYEANVKALMAAKSMAQRALEIGGK